MVRSSRIQRMHNDLIRKANKVYARCIMEGYPRKKVTMAFITKVMADLIDDDELWNRVRRELRFNEFIPL